MGVRHCSNAWPTPSQRQKIVAETEQILQDRFGGEGVYLPAMKRELADVMREMGVSAGEAIARLLEQPNQSSVIIRFGIEEDLKKILQFRDASIACDCGATTSTATHPRNYGTYPRVLGRYVREQKVLTWQDAIRKMTALPAATIGMYDRGYLAPGMKADVAVIDPVTVIDHATYEEPSLLSQGVRHVFVNGAWVLRHGFFVGAQGGRVLKRGSGGVREPSRPMSVQRRALRVRARNEEFVLTIDIAQGPGDRRARGTVRMIDRKTGHPRTFGDLGVLQVAAGWASLTSEHYTIVVDRGDAAHEANVMLITTEEGKAYRFAVEPRDIRITFNLR